MRIVFFTDTYEPQINGVVTSIKVLEKHLRRMKHEVHVFCPADRGTRKRKFIHTVKSVRFKPYPEYRIALPSAKIVSEMRRIKPDVVHIQSPAPLGLMGLAAAKILGIPAIATYPTLLTANYQYLFGRFPEKISKRIIIGYTKWFYNKVDAAIAPSSPIKKLLESCGVKKKIFVIPNGLETGSCRKIRGKNKTPLLIHVGRLCKEKQIDIVIRAFKKVLEKTKCRLVITSDGPDRKRLESLAASLGIKGSVSFTGYVPDSSIKKFYENGDALVYASQTETQGLVVLESMMRGCPVIVPESMGFKDIVKNNFNGISYKPVSEKTLARKIIQLLSNEKMRRKFIRNGYRTLERFDAKNTTNGLLKIYHSLSN